MIHIYKSNRKTKKHISAIFFTALVVSLILCVWFMTDSLKNTHDEKTMESSEKAIIKSAVQCYALEGQYPTGIEYLEEHYGLTLNRDKYVYHYESIGANMVPVVNVYPLN